MRSGRRPMPSPEGTRLMFAGMILSVVQLVDQQTDDTQKTRQEDKKRNKKS